MVLPRIHNTAHHIGHLQALANGTSQEGQALVAYGSKKFHDAILHTIEKARQEGHHLAHGLHKDVKDVIDYFGNNRISKKERLAQIQAHTQSGGSWKKFWRGVKHAFHKTTHWVVKAAKDSGKWLGRNVFTKENINNAFKIGANLSEAAAKVA